MSQRNYILNQSNIHFEAKYCLNLTLNAWHSDFCALAQRPCNGQGLTEEEVVKTLVSLNMFFSCLCQCNLLMGTGRCGFTDQTLWFFPMLEAGCYYACIQLIPIWQTEWTQCATHVMRIAAVSDDRWQQVWTGPPFCVPAVLASHWYLL